MIGSRLRRRRGGHRPRVVVYTRQDCGLCRTAERLAASEAGGAEVVLIDIDADPELQRRYHVRVPVIEVDGALVAEAHVPPGSVARAVRHAGRRGAGSGDGRGAS